MKTKIILLSIFILYPIQLLAYSICTTNTVGLEDDYNQTLFVIVKDPDFAQRDKLQYALDRLLCLIPQNSKFRYILLDGMSRGQEFSDLRLVKADIAGPGFYRNDFCEKLRNKIHDIVHNDRIVQIIVSKSTDDTCDAASHLEELTTPTHGGIFRINVILFDEWQVTRHNSVLLPLTSIDTSLSDTPTDMQESLEKFITKMLEYVEIPVPPMDPHEHDHQHNHHRRKHGPKPKEGIETWKLLAIIITVVAILLLLIIASLLIRKKLKSKKEQDSKSGSRSGDDDKQIIATKKLTKAPLTPSSITPSAESAEKTKMSKERPEKTKSTLSYSITLESVKSKKKRFSKESGSKEGASKETVSHASAETAEKPKLKKSSKRAKNNIV